MTRALALALVMLGCREPTAAPAPDASRDAAASDQDCAACHVEQAASWSRSMHAMSARDSIYRAEHEPGNDPWCTGCHAPVGEARGIDCEVCHLREGSIAAREVSGRAPHVSHVEPEMTERVCGGCHDFDFPRGPARPMQDTLDEWRASAAGQHGAGCVACHDPHLASGRRDPALLARALEVRASVVTIGDRARVQLTLRSRAGHAVPTGDLFRRLVVRVASRERVLGRTFRERDGMRFERADTRVPAQGTRTVTLEVPRAARIEWTIELHALAEARARVEGLPDRAWRSEVAHGVLLAPRGQ